MNSKQILNKRRNGDIKLVADIMGESYQNTWQVLRREKAKKHPRAIAILKSVIEAREKSITEIHKDKENEM